MRGDVSLILPIKVDRTTQTESALSCINVKNHFSYILAYCHDAHLGLGVSVWCYGHVLLCRNSYTCKINLLFAYMYIHAPHVSSDRIRYREGGERGSRSAR